MNAAWAKRRGIFCIAVGCLLLIACPEPAPVPSASAPVVSTDLAKLRALVTVPPGVVSARWLARPLRPEGSRLVPGPTDTILFAYLETSATFWSDQGSRFPETNGSPQRVSVSDAKALLPAAVLASATQSGDVYQLHCDRLVPDALSRSPQRARMALHCGSGMFASFTAE